MSSQSCSADETPRHHAVEREPRWAGDVVGGRDPSAAGVREAARRLAERHITPGQLYFVLDLFLPDGWETEAFQDALRNDQRGVLSAGEVLARICSAASRVSQALVLRETTDVETPARTPNAAQQTDLNSSAQEQEPMVFDEDVCEICGTNYAAPELRGVECWECYGEH